MDINRIPRKQQKGTGMKRHCTSVMGGIERWLTYVILIINPERQV